MRFLCLHGAGTNSRIFEIQTAALRHELAGDHAFHFVEGTVPFPMHPAIEGLAAPDDEFFGYYKTGDAGSFLRALAQLESYVAKEGPFDGVFCFSQGTSLAAAHILQKQQAALRNGRKEGPLQTDFRCAVFFSGRPPLLDAGMPSLPGESAVAKDQDGGLGLIRIRIPTMHIWGAEDSYEPGQGQALTEFCTPCQVGTYIHAGGHEVPGPRHPSSLTGAVHVIRRGLARVEDE